MIKKKRWNSVISICLVIVLFIFVPVASINAEEIEATNNRFNVVLVVDASNSINYTDPSGLRYEAISQFTNLLAEQGNYLGGIVFSNHVEAKQEPILVSKQDDKDKMVALMKSVMSTEATSDMGYTNVGEALSVAVEMLETNGNTNLPSVIVFFSDGNTEMPTDDEQSVSLSMKADAIQVARENKISIYSVCLNANNKADTSEMEQISQATGGEFREVKKAEDLQEVFNSFYNLIYGTSTIMLVDNTFPADGKIKANFDVPGIGVEEVNIIIYGKTSEVRLFRPDKSESDASVINSDTFTMIKLTDVLPGTWSLVAQGKPGDQIKINMVYNTNLEVLISAEPEEKIINPADSLKIKACLKSGNTNASDSSQYSGYEAIVQIMDAYGESINEIPMQVKDDHFELDYKFEEGTYYFKVNVIGNHMEKMSESYGPLIVTKEALTEKQKNNTPPEAVNNPVEETVYIWPFRENGFSIDLETLAKDRQDSKLIYKILSSSFIEGSDYTVNDNVLNLENFSLSKGAFTVSATDSGGLSCEIEIIITSRNVGLMALIVIAIIVLIIIIVLGIMLWIALTKPFRGTVSAQSYCNGTYKGTPRTKSRGRIKLTAFGMDPVGLDYNKSYIQATGQQFVYLVTNKPVIWNGQKTSKVRIQSGAEVTITVSDGDSRLIYIRFDSRIKGRVSTNRGAHRRPNVRR